MNDRNKRIKLLVEKLNKEMAKKSSLGRIDLGSAIEHIQAEKIPTGVLSWDWTLGGGIPRGMGSQSWGPWSTGKTTLAMVVARTLQKRSQGSIFWAAAEEFDKERARQLGCLIPYSEEELEAIAQDDQEIADEFEREQADWPEFVVARHVHGDALLELTCDALRSNLFDLTVVDSIAVCERARMLDKSLEDESYGGNSGLLTAFTKKATSAMANRYNADGAPDPEGADPNRTALLVLNQARQVIGGKVQGLMRPVGAEALRHLWGTSTQLKRGVKYKAGKRTIAIEMRATNEKNKTGVPYRSAAWKLYIDDHDGHLAGDIDRIADVTSVAEVLGVVERNGSTYVYDGTKFKGMKGLVAMLENEESALDKMYNECSEAM